jgi:hypothetical protein
VMSSRGKIRLSRSEVLMVGGEGEGWKNDCEDTGEGTKG